jgi:hypothetical protein
MLEAAFFFCFSESWPLTFRFLTFVFYFISIPDPSPNPERKYVNVGFTKIIFTTMCPVVGYRYTSVADPGCFLNFIHPGSRIEKQQQKRGVKKNLL